MLQEILSRQPAAPFLPPAVFTAGAQEGHLWHKGIFLPALSARGEVRKETPVGTATRRSSKREPQRVMPTMWAGWRFLCHGIHMLEHASIIKIPGGETKRRRRGKGQAEKK